MATHTINDAVLHSPEAEAYFTRADSRVLIGLRAALELLGLPSPMYALRRKPGPTPAKAVTAAYQAGSPAFLSTSLRSRKPNASPATVAAARQRRALNPA